MNRENIVSQTDFEGQVAIVTGAGRNLGRCYAIDLARRGAAVIVNDIDGDAANDVVEAIERAGGTAVASLDTVATVEGGEAIVARAVEHYGTVDIVVNNAGNVRAGSFAEMSLADFEAVLAVHLSGAFCVTQPAWKVMQKQGGGRVVMTGSAGGVYPEQGYSEYATAKAGVVGLTRALAAEGREHGIYVNAILPQAGGSAMTSSVGPISGIEDARFSVHDARLGPYKSAAAVSPLVMYLCSSACTQSGLVLSAGAGWFGRVFLGLTDGWVAPELGIPTSPEEVARHFDEIVDPVRYQIPDGASDELLHIATRLGLVLG